MSEAFVGEIRMFAGDYAPQGWLPCDGRLLDINGNEVLFSLLSTTYGGDGRTNFNLPDLRGRLAIGMGQGQNPPLTNRPLAQQTGVETVTLTEANIPAHNHSFAVGSAATSNSPAGGMVPAAVSGFKLYASTATSGSSLDPKVVQPAPGGSQPHNNVMPSIPISFIICLQGLYPSFP
ncbi:MAG: phage tail protein [Comamonadaceae bacterium SCN 68-20]|nr:phage tail protein [Comamonadaceae bacterium]ODU59754.1 MAG: phage tail protein [Comamonadaceae bacterium SCN 68-20]OJX30534.1 MAG: phage tail protein [Burkholderiales bacterium 68-20]